ncbi:Ig-like domain-containing protein, partial [Erwinia sp. B116]|uniref:Ig-like domain-containing protein n=1 Tax=Erwinia sp. B116 TaxID=1561024 RepID=UPI0018EAA51B
ITTDGGITWKGTYTPNADVTDATNLIVLNQTYVHDAAGNTGQGLVESDNFAIDTQLPTATIQLSDTALKAGEASTVTITFSEAVSGLTREALTAPNGTLSELISTDGGITWKGTYTPAADVTDATNQLVLNQTW